MFFNLAHSFQRTLALLLLADVASCLQTVETQPYDPSPFNFIGTIDAMTLDVTGGPLAGGTIAVKGFNVTVPKNTLVTLPSITCAWSEMFTVDASNNTIPNLPLLGSVSWETTIFGNIVRGEKIAGLIFMVQESTQLLQGFITEIDYTTGHFWVDTTVECVLNDPLGRFGRPFTGNPLWTVDPDNPSVHSTTGVPLCIPRNATDSECPLTNRPVDGNGFFLTSFTFPDPALVVPGGLDPSIMVPLVVGDYLTFSGTSTADGILEVYSLEANLGIYTAPGTKPAYIAVEAAQYAIVSPDPTLESDETRATAVASDPSTTIEWFAMDLDPCTGETTERNLLLVQPESAAPIGLTTFRLGKTDASPATRNVGFRYSNGIAMGPKGIIAGQFIQPIMLFIFPELIDYGANEVPNQFDEIPFLAMGSGPLVFGNFLAEALPTPTIVGQLSPWPGLTPPGTTSCAPITSSTSTASSGSASSSPTAPPGGIDVIEVLSATATNQKGATTTTVTALTTSSTAQLFMAIIGVDNVAAQPMTPLGGGQFTLSIVTKGKPSFVEISSSQGGAPVILAV